MLVGVAGGQERQEHLVVPAEVAGDDVGARLDIVQDRAVVLLHPARRAAGAAGVDDAGEVGARRPWRCALDSAVIAGSPATSSLQWWSMVPSIAWPARMSSMPMMWWHSDENSTAGSSGLASFWFETITALAPELPRMCGWSRVVLVV